MTASTNRLDTSAAVQTKQGQQELIVTPLTVSAGVLTPKIHILGATE